MNWNYFKVFNNLWNYVESYAQNNWRYKNMMDVIKADCTGIDTKLYTKTKRLGGLV